jgi:uncharacterized RDD family membrane protein YckC
MSAPTPPSGGGIPGPGYYPDPSIPGYVRYWNGAAWVPGTSRRAQEGDEDLVAPAEHAGADGTETPEDPADAGPADAAPADAVSAEPAGPSAPAAPPVSETGPVFLDEEEPQDAPRVSRGRHARLGGDEDDARADVRDAAEAAASVEAPADAQGAWQSVDVVDVAERADSRVAWGAQDRQDPPALTVPTELGGGAPGPGRAEEEPRLPGARRAADSGPADAGAADAGGGAGAAPEGGQAAAGSYEEDRPGVPLGRDPRVGGGSWGEQVRRLAGPAPVPAPATPPEGAPEPEAGAGRGVGSGAGSGTGGADPRQAAGAYAPSPTAPDAPPALPAPTAPDLPRAQPSPTTPDVPAARPVPPSPTTPDLPQPRPAQPQLAPQAGPTAPPLTPAARTAPPAAAPPQQPVGQLPERAARAELPQGGGAGTGEPPVVPWRPPANDPFRGAAQGTAPPAGLGRRLGARLVDVLLVGGVVGAVATPLVSKSVDHVQDKIDAAEASGKTVTVWLVDGTTGPYLAIVLGLFLVLGLLVEALPTAKWGRTPGKRLFGVRVLDIESQDPPATGSALRRWLTYAVFVLLPLVGLLNVLWCAFDKPWRQCWHDKAGRTYVARG